MCRREVGQPADDCDDDELHGGNVEISVRTASAAGPGLTTAVGPVLTTAAGPVLTTAAGPVLTTAAGPGLTTAAGPVLTTAAGPELTTAAGPGLTTSLRSAGSAKPDCGRHNCAVLLLPTTALI